MKESLKALMLLAACVQMTSNAALYDTGFANGGAIPDGSLVGWSDTRTISGMGNSITDVSVRLEFSGGYNGDLYAYLAHDGVLLPLLNRVGTGTGSGSTFEFGFTTSGMNVWLSDSGTTDIHNVGSPSDGGTYAPDGRIVSPLAGGEAISSSDRIGFSTFHGMNANGDWTLFFADVSGGGSVAKVEAWELGITAVPEPVNVALGIFGAVALGSLLLKRRGKAMG